MKTNRRNFLRKSGLAGVGLASAGILHGYSTDKVKETAELQKTSYKQKFNMSGYAAPTSGVQSIHLAHGQYLTVLIPSMYLISQADHGGPTSRLT